MAILISVLLLISYVMYTSFLPVCGQILQFCRTELHRLSCTDVQETLQKFCFVSQKSFWDIYSRIKVFTMLWSAFPAARLPKDGITANGRDMAKQMELACFCLCEFESPFVCCTVSQLWGLNHQTRVFLFLCLCGIECGGLKAGAKLGAANLSQIRKMTKCAKHLFYHKKMSSWCGTKRKLYKHKYAHRTVIRHVRTKTALQPKACGSTEASCSA